jgi:hypothetical protein
MPLIKRSAKPPPRWFFTASGILMISHFAYIVSRCMYQGRIEDIFWISHIGTLIGGFGAVFRNRLLISVALVSLAGHHGFWLLDTGTWLLTGDFLFGTTSYLQNADIYEWLQSSNHFFSMPLLLILAFYQQGIKKNAWVWSSLLFAFLIVLSFFISPGTSDVNCAHHLWPGLNALFPQGLDRLPPTLYIGSVIGINALGNYLPGYLILIFLLGKARDDDS